MVRCKVMNKKTGKYEGKNLNAVATAEHYYSLKKNQNHYRIAKYLSQELKISATLKSLLLDLNVLYLMETLEYSIPRTRLLLDFCDFLMIASMSKT